MCGIAGQVGSDTRDRAPAMRAMRDRLVHRGPDSAGEFIAARAAMGVRRLRIIDLVTGDQPQANEDGSVWTVFNGEIYNFLDLREELTRRGHRLRTRSDTEVIVHLYEDHGERLVEHLEGMFALAVWDAKTGTLVLARDRLGKKPLLYAETAGELTFASEHAALLAGLAERPPVDPTAIHLYLRLGYVPAPNDAYVGVRKLPPGHLLIWRDGVGVTRRYWSPPRAGTLRIEEPDAVSEVRRLLERAVARRLIADVPIGAFLSGGIDSSAVVAMMARLTPKVRTFTIGFDERTFSEVEHARRVATLFGTEHHELLVRPLATDVLPLLVRHYGEPYADSSALPTYYVSRLARETVTVALNGDGGDELFAGYDRYVALRLASALDLIPSAIRTRSLLLLAAAIPGSASAGSPAGRLRRFLRGAALPLRERYREWTEIFDRPLLAELLTPEFAATGTAKGPGIDEDGWSGADPVRAAQTLDLALYLPDDLLVKVDIAAMANSLEIRCPLLDRELVEFVVQLPTDLKLRGRERKYLLKRALSDVLPRSILDRRKHGFGVPVGAWFRGELRDFLQDVVLSSAALDRGYFRAERLTRLVQDHLDGRADHGQRLWALLMLELWHREFTDRTIVQPRAQASFAQ